MLALSQQRPILATSTGGLGELLAAVDCGISIEAPTVDAVIAAIERASEAPPELLRRKGLNGYAYVVSRRSWESIARRTAEVYSSLPAHAVAQAAQPRIVMHTPEPASSAALYVDALTEALAAESVRVRVVCPANHQALEAMGRNPLIEVWACCDRAIQRGFSRLDKIAGNLRFIASSCRTLLRATKPGCIIHFQFVLHFPFGLIFFLCAKLKRARIIFTVHNPLPHKFLFPRRWHWAEMETLGLAYKWSDSLIVHSEAGKRKLVDTFHLRPEKIRVIVHGPYKLKKSVLPCAETTRLEVLFFGSLRENKGVHLAIEAAQSLVSAGVRLRLTIAGDVLNRKEQGYWKRCRALIDPKSAAIRLIETFVPDDDLPELFSNCHCFLLPYTTFSSDSGVAYMALANGKPIVATGAGGLEWLLENSRGGVLVHETTVEGVASALREAVDLGPAKLERMGRVGAEWVLTTCGWPRAARETRDLYAQFIPQLAAARMFMEDAEDAVASMGVAHEQ
jgi:glycogen(starch) synthase